MIDDIFPIILPKASYFAFLSLAVLWADAVFIPQFENFMVKR
jgi:hypothetical protein